MAELLALLPVLSGVATCISAALLWSERWDQRRANGQAAARLAGALRLTLDQLEAGLGARTRATPGMVLALDCLDKLSQDVHHFLEKFARKGVLGQSSGSVTRALQAFQDRHNTVQNHIIIALGLACQDDPPPPYKAAMHPRRATEPTITDARLAIAKSELALKEKLGVFPWKDDIPNPTSAMIYYREACRMVPSNPVYHFRLGLCYCRSGIELQAKLLLKHMDKAATINAYFQNGLRSLGEARRLDPRNHHYKRADTKYKDEHKKWMNGQNSDCCIM